MTRAPLRPTLLPYTTLFRSASGNDGPGHGHAVGPLPARWRTLGVCRADAREFPELSERSRRPAGDIFLLILEIRGDRKSTRLNSSHSQISYAVFCLQLDT